MPREPSHLLYRIVEDFWLALSGMQTIVTRLLDPGSLFDVHDMLSEASRSLRNVLPYPFTVHQKCRGWTVCYQGQKIGVDRPGSKRYFIFRMHTALFQPLSAMHSRLWEIVWKDAREPPIIWSYIFTCVLTCVLVLMFVSGSWVLSCCRVFASRH